MAVYNTSNALAGTQQANAATYKTQLMLTAATATLTRALVQEVDVGAAGTPADNYLEYDVSRTTGGAAGTSTSATPTPTDLTFRAAGTVAAVNFTAEPTTIQTSLLYFALNQRATYRWVAAPGSELVIPATNLAGLVFRSRSAVYTGFVSAQTVHLE